MAGSIDTLCEASKIKENQYARKSIRKKKVYKVWRVLLMVFI